MPPREVGGYTLGCKIGSGSFGDVYHGRGPAGEEVAIKLERISPKSVQLQQEWKLYSSLAGGEGIPKVYWFGKAGKYNALVMELLGPSLEELFKKHDKRFSLKTTLMLAEQMIQRLEFVHRAGILHRDIKPNNFLIGRGADSCKVYLVDFGLSKTYLQRKGDKHIPYKDGRTGLTGTARYTSINNHNGIELARRDDLEGLGYVLVRMLRGTLPWQGIKAETKPLRNELIKQTKVSTSLAELCKGLPKEFSKYIATCRAMNFYDRPDYDELRRLMHDALKRDQHACDFVFDWHNEKDSDVSTCYSASEKPVGQAELIKKSIPTIEVDDKSEEESQNSEPPSDGKGAVAAAAPEKVVPAPKAPNQEKRPVSAEKRKAAGDKKRRKAEAAAAVPKRSTSKRERA
eukprot:TRINITY_DN93350_c0_g1_i1.p1 TRINITY_DN93350_c0_g1~~TRINITY_DN93350_c0_g1_i1.p1  ORF type:complete len:426 (-),score=81.67 TRINITY_DN93350_c0_g1_i1:209-1411(-)